MHLIIAAIAEYGLLAVFLSVFLDTIGLPFPSYPVLMAAAALAVNLHHPVLEIVLTGAGAAMLADMIWFWSGRRYGTRVIKLMCKISLSPDSCVRNTHTLFSRVGPKALTFTKFVPGFSNIAIVLAGVGDVRLVPFVFFDFIGVTIYVGVGVTLGVLFHDAIEDVLAVLARLGEGGLLLIAAAFGIFIFQKWLQRHRFMRQLRMDRVTVAELRDMIDKGAPPVILDVRPPDIRRLQGVIPGSIAASYDEFAQVVGDFPADAEVVVYCSCPSEASAALAAKHLRKAGYRKIRPLLGGIEAWIEAGNPVEAFPRVSLAA